MLSSCPALAVLIIEGEFKTLALWRLANHGSRAQPRFLPLGISGVYNWRGTIGKTVGPDGSRLDVKGAIPDLDWITWEGRRVIIAYDADVVAKDHVRIARASAGGGVSSEDGTTHGPNDCSSAPTAGEAMRTGTALGNTTCKSSPTKPGWKSSWAITRREQANGTRSNIACSPSSA
jgi:hypothetical protein